MNLLAFQFSYAIAPSQYQLAFTQPNSYTYSPWSIGSPYTTNAYTNAYTTSANAYTTSPNAYSTSPNAYTTSANAYSTTPQLSAAALQQSQIIPYTTTAQGSYILTPSQLQQLSFGVPQTPTAAAATVQPLSYTTASPSSTLAKVQPATAVASPATTIVSPTTASFYSSAPASHSYQQSPTFRKLTKKRWLLFG